MNLEDFTVESLIFQQSASTIANMNAIAIHLATTQHLDDWHFAFYTNVKKFVEHHKNAPEPTFIENDIVVFAPASGLRTNDVYFVIKKGDELSRVEASFKSAREKYARYIQLITPPKNNERDDTKKYNINKKRAKKETKKRSIKKTEKKINNKRHKHHDSDSDTYQDSETVDSDNEEFDNEEFDNNEYEDNNGGFHREPNRWTSPNNAVPFWYRFRNMNFDAAYERFKAMREREEQNPNYFYENMMNAKKEREQQEQQQNDARAQRLFENYFQDGDVQNNSDAAE